jgi:hypothetical protein
LRKWGNFFGRHVEQNPKWKCKSEKKKKKVKKKAES